MSFVMRALQILAGVLMFCSCTHSVHLMNFSETRPYKKMTEGRQVMSHTTQFSVMGFTTETNYVNEAYQQLQQQCPAGIVTAIATKYYTDHGFFSWTNHIVMDGTCFAQLSSSK